MTHNVTAGDNSFSSTTSSSFTFERTFNLNDQAVLDIEFTSGGIFDTPSEIVRTGPLGADGILTLKFDNCSTGTVDYDITTINARGTVPIQRVANDNVALRDALLRESH